MATEAVEHGNTTKTVLTQPVPTTWDFFFILKDWFVLQPEGQKSQWQK